MRLGCRAWGNYLCYYTYRLFPRMGVVLELVGGQGLPRSIRVATAVRREEVL